MIKPFYYSISRTMATRIQSRTSYISSVKRLSSEILTWRHTSLKFEEKLVKMTSITLNTDDYDPEMIVLNDRINSAISKVFVQCCNNA